MSAEARRELPAPTALDDGGRNDEALLASGVLLRFPMTWFPDMLSIIHQCSKSGKKMDRPLCAREGFEIRDVAMRGIGKTRPYSCSDLLTSKEFSTRRAAGYRMFCWRKQGQSWECVSTQFEAPAWCLGAAEDMAATSRPQEEHLLTAKTEVTVRQRKYGVCVQAGNKNFDVSAAEDADQSPVIAMLGRVRHESRCLRQLMSLSNS